MTRTRKKGVERKGSNQKPTGDAPRSRKRKDRCGQGNVIVDLIEIESRTKNGITRLEKWSSNANMNMDK